MDTRETEAAQGAVAVVSALEMDRLPKVSWNVADLFGGREIQHYHQDCHRRATKSATGLRSLNSPLSISRTMRRLSGLTSA